MLNSKEANQHSVCSMKWHKIPLESFVQKVVLKSNQNLNYKSNYKPIENIEIFKTMLLGYNQQNQSKAHFSDKVRDRLRERERELLTG